MKKTSLIISGTIIFAIGFGAGFFMSSLQKHDMPPPPFMEGSQMHRPKKHPLADKLGLTEEQRKFAEENHEKGRKEIKPLMEKMFEIRKQMDEIREANMAEFEKILTKEQRQKFEKIKNKMHKWEKKHPKPFHKAPHNASPRHQ